MQYNTLIFTLGLPEIKVTEENDANDQRITILSMSYGNNRYLRTSLLFNGRSVFLKKLEFNMFNIKGTFKSKEPQNSSTDTDEGMLVNF